VESIFPGISIKINAMEISKILTADVLDIIFEGRNKSYGAYELRKSYRRRLVLSITVMLSIILLLLGGYALANMDRKESLAREIVIPDTELKVLTPEEKVEPPPPIKTPPPAKVEMKQFTTFKIEKDEKVKPEEAPPPNEELEDVKIGSVNQEGLKDEGIVAPPVDNGNAGVTAIVKKEEPDYNTIFTKVEIDAKYPGGTAAWARYLNKNLQPNIPQEAIDNAISGRLEIKFVVDTLGNVSDVEAISGPKELWEMGVKVIKKSGKWEPAIQNGRKVKSYKRQPIIVTIEEN
jgi:protein TonB